MTLSNFAHQKRGCLVSYLLYSEYRKVMNMEWLNHMNDAIEYMENHLTGELDLDKAAQLAACSTFHFQRMFTYIAGIPLAEYLRRRRMTAAAFELTTSNVKIIDLAAKYGYESPTAFNRAFQSIHGLPPTTARAEGVRLTAFPRITFTLSVKGEAAMNYKIEKKDTFNIVGVKTALEMNIEDSFAKVPIFWQENAHRIPEICTLMNGKAPLGILGVSTSMNGKDCDYFIAAVSDAQAPEGMSEYMVPAATWAIFECVGPMPSAIQTLQKRIITEWLPSSGYEYADAPDIEVYGEGDQSSVDYRCEVWLPIVKKD